MGNYTELVMACNLKPSVPDQVVKTLNYLLGEDRDVEKLDEQSSALFKGHPGILRFYSYYFPGKDASELVFDTISNAYHLNVRMSIKNYYHFIDIFLCWLAPYSESQGFIGYKRNEMSDHPDLLYFKKGTAFQREISNQTRLKIAPVVY